MHSRAMSPASHQGLVFSFIANEDSGKFDELENDENVNISFSDSGSTDWASVAGKARVTKDEKTCVGSFPVACCPSRLAQAPARC